VLELDRTLAYYTVFNVLHIVVVWWLVVFVCTPTTYHLFLKMFLPLSNVFYFAVIAGGPVINNLFVKIKFCYTFCDLLFSMVLPPVITFVNYDFDAGQVLVVLRRKLID
jgi:hypothetical protein